jgi:hypothetical protein
MYWLPLMPEIRIGLVKYPCELAVFCCRKTRISPSTLTGKVLDMEYARVLARNPELSLDEIILLDKVQKRKSLTDDELKQLRTKGLIEGKKPTVRQPTI